MTLIWSCLFLGVYEEPEFSEQRLFIKHRPTFNWFFPVPLGGNHPYVVEDSDLPIEGMDEKERLYFEFVAHGGGNKRSIYFVPSLWYKQIFKES